MLAPLAPSAATTEAAALVVVEHTVPGGVRGLDADANGAWVLNDSGILRVALDGTRTMALELDAGWPSGLRALDDGSFLLTDGSALSVRKVRADGQEPVLRASRALYDLGPDGALYAVTSNHSHSTLVRLEPGTRDVTVLAHLPTDYVRDLEFAPSGELFAVYGRYVERYEEETGSFVRVYSSTGEVSAIAFDAAGRMYVTRGGETSGGYSTWLVRVDQETGWPTYLVTLANDRVHSLAFGGTRLYASIDTWPYSDRPNLVHVDLGVPGFEGFAGSLPLPPAGDLAITSLVVERGPPLHPYVRNDVNEVRTIVVTVTNVGPGAAEGKWSGYVYPGSDSLVSRALVVNHPPGPRGQSFNFEGSLESGESRTFRLPWDVTLSAGQYVVYASVDGSNEILELDEVGNNRAWTTAVVRTTF